MMDFADYLASFNARVAAARARKAEQEAAAAEARDTAVDAAMAYMAGMNMEGSDDAIGTGDVATDDFREHR